MRILLIILLYGMYDAASRKVYRTMMYYHTLVYNNIYNGTWVT